jgi:hypothetical protein
MILASFPVSFARHPCPCAHPNYRNCGAWCEETGIRNFPAAGALVYVWQFPVPRNPAALGRGFGHRPPRFRITQVNPHFATGLARELRRQHRRAGHVCVAGPSSLPSWWSQFRAGDRAFQVEVYLGPRAGGAVRASLDGLLDSLRLHPRHRPAPPTPTAGGGPITLAQFSALRLGESEARVTNEFGMPERRTRVVRYGFTHDEPRGLRCIYYRRRSPDDGAPESTSDTFQLCFAGQRLRYRWAYIASRA